MTDDARDLLAEIDATLKLGRERHLDFREQAFDLLVRLRPMVEREVGGETSNDVWDEVIACFNGVWSDDPKPHYNNSPTELIYRLINERDELHGSKEASVDEVMRLRRLFGVRSFPKFPDDGSGGLWRIMQEVCKEPEWSGRHDYIKGAEAYRRWAIWEALGWKEPAP